MEIALKRAYESPSSDDGCRVLVDRIWPRGVSRDDLDLDEWRREIAPSDRLRRAFHDGEIGWGTFRNRYLSELKEHRDALRELAGIAQDGRLTLVYAASDAKRNNAVVLKQYLQLLDPPPPSDS